MFIKWPTVCSINSNLNLIIIIFSYGRFINKWITVFFKLRYSLFSSFLRFLIDYISYLLIINQKWCILSKTTFLFVLLFILLRENTNNLIIFVQLVSIKITCVQINFLYVLILLTNRIYFFFKLDWFLSVWLNIQNLFFIALF
jgi:hypothetical protein